MANPKKIFDAALKLKNARAAKDAKIISSSPHLKQTPNMTLGQAKVMKKATKELATTTKKISNRSNRRKQDNLTVGEFNSFLARMGLDKPTTFPNTTNIKALNTPSIGGKINAPSNMTLRQVNRGSFLEEEAKSKAYAAAYRQAKRETKQFKLASQSSTTRAVKKTAKVGIPLISGGSALAYQQKRNK